MDLFDDVIDSGASSSARAGGKFQPKCKPRPRRQPSTLVSSVSGSETKEMNNAVSQPGDMTENIAIHEALATPDVLSNANHENVESSSLESAKPASEMDGFKDSMTFDVTANGDSNPIITTAAGVPAAELKLSPRGSILFEEPIANDCFVRKFQPRMKPCLRKEASISIVSTLDNDGTENPCTSASVVETDCCVDTRKDSEVALAAQSSTTSEIIRSKESLTVNCNASVKFSDDTTSFGLFNYSIHGALSVQNGKVPAVRGIEVVSDGSGDFLSSLHKSSVENVDIFSGLDCLDDYLNQPGSGEERICCNPTSTTVEPSQCESVEQNHTCSDPNIEVPVEPSQCESDEQNHTCSDPNIEVPANEAPTRDAKTCNFPSVFTGNVHSEHFSAMPEESAVKIREGISSTIMKIPLKHKNCCVADEYECVPSTRQLRNRVPHQHVDDRVDEACEDSENEKNDDDYNDNDMLGSRQKEKASKKSKKEAVENEKPVRKRKVAGEGARSDSRGKGPKKFPHSTRRKKRYVDKTLLDTPEDEIEFSKIRFKDLIIYHEYKERVAKKEAKTQLRDDRADSGVNKEGSHNGEEEYASEQQRGSDNDDETYIKVDSNSEYFNYHTYMNKTPRVKWSKQDTELFYEAVRQFGTDFYMIQELFPGRTHHQVKLKFKNEERQRPLQISEALTCRSKDHSHFISLMKRLQEVSAQEKCKSEEDELIELARMESDLNPETNEEAAKSELDEEININNKEESTGEVHSPSKSCDEDDDPYKWSQYNSDL